MSWNLNCVSFTDLLKISKDYGGISKLHSRRSTRLSRSYDVPKRLPRSLRQVHVYLSDQDVRGRVLERVISGISTETRLVVAHSLGSIAAYEALTLFPLYDVHTIVTLGSPLWIPYIFNRLCPGMTNGRRAWPPKVERWINISYVGDIVAVVGLRPLFGDGTQIEDKFVLRAVPRHSLSSYLSSASAGFVIAEALSGTSSPTGPIQDLGRLSVTRTAPQSGDGAVSSALHHVR